MLEEFNDVKIDSWKYLSWSKDGFLHNLFFPFLKDIDYIY